MSHETEQRRPVFPKGDLFWFLVLPLLMAAAYFGYRSYQQSNVDPNLQLVARFSDDVSIELKAIAFNSNFGTPRNRWWKPNGLDFPEFKPNASIGRAATTPPEVARTLVFEINNKSETQLKFRTKLRTTNRRGDWWSTTSQKESLIYMTCPVNEGYFAANDFTIEMATRGTQTVGRLTPDKPKVEVVLAGVNATLETVKSEDGESLEVMLSGPPGVNLSTQPLLKRLAMMSQIRLNCSFEPAAKPVEAEPNFSRKEYTQPFECKFFWRIPKQNWLQIEINFIDYDQIAEFQDVSVTPGVITTPRVIGPKSAKE